jgi:peptidoglycan hydrolase-like protein with peptidoglycan-binding domain
MTDPKLWIRTQIQQVLAAIGYYDGKIDGIFGAESVAALKKYQQVNDLPNQDGQPDDATMARLFPQGLKMSTDTPAPGTSVVVPVKSAILSKVNWTQALQIILTIVGLFLPISDDLKLQIIAVANGLGSIITIVIKTWFTSTVTPASAAKL